MKLTTRKQLQDLLATKNVMAFLHLITRTEGTYQLAGNSFERAHGILFGGAKFTDFSKHPRVKNVKHNTSAAGAYQIQPGTWDGQRKKFKWPDFSPRCQQECAVALINYRGALEYVVQGNWSEAFRLCRNEWTSLPGASQSAHKRGWNLKNCIDFCKNYSGVNNSAESGSVSASPDGYIDNQNTTETLIRNCGVDGVTFPATAGNPQYPYNKTYTSSSGHLVEYDDTPGEERINIYHKTGTYIMMDKNGNLFHHAKEGEFTYVGGMSNEIVTESKNIKVLGNCNLNVDGVWNVKASSANFDIPVIRQAGVLYNNEVYVQGTKMSTHVHNGVFLGADISGAPIIQGDTVESMGADDSVYQEVLLTKAQTARLVTNGQMTQSEADEYHSTPESSTGKSADVTSTGGTGSVSAYSGSVPRDSKGNLNLKSKVGKYVTLQQCVTGKHSFKAQKGLSLNQIYINMATVVTNCFDVIKAKYPSARISSGFRNGTNNSQHNLGQALDIVFDGIPKSKYFDIAKEIKGLIPFDQLLLEYRGKTSAWIHVSLKPSGTNRGQILTLVNDKTYSTGLTKYI